MGRRVERLGLVLLCAALVVELALGATCEDGMILDNGTCVACPTGYWCKSDTKTACPAGKSTYDTNAFSEAFCYNCLPGSACQAGGVCTEGYRNAPGLCGECGEADRTQGFFRMFGACLRCPGQFGLWASILTVGAVLVAMLVLIMHLVNESSSPWFFYFRQLLLYIQWQSFVIASFSDFWPSLSVDLSFGLQWMVNIDLPTIFFSPCTFPDIDYFTTYTMLVHFPVFIIALYGLIFLVSTSTAWCKVIRRGRSGGFDVNLRAAWDHIHNKFDQTIHAVTWIISVMMLLVVHKVIEPITCNTQEDGRKFMIAPPHKECDFLYEEEPTSLGRVRPWMMNVVFVCFVYMFLVPLAYWMVVSFGFMFDYLDRPSFRSKVGWMYTAYSTRRGGWMWEILAIAHKAALGDVVGNLYPHEASHRTLWPSVAMLVLLVLIRPARCTNCLLSDTPSCGHSFNMGNMFLIHIYICEVIIALMGFLVVNNNTTATGEGFINTATIIILLSLFAHCTVNLIVLARSRHKYTQSSLHRRLEPSVAMVDGRQSEWAIFSTGGAGANIISKLNIYPPSHRDPGLEENIEVPLHSSETGIRCGALTAGGKFAFFAANLKGTSKGRIIKVRAGIPTKDKAKSAMAGVSRGFFFGNIAGLVVGTVFSIFIAKDQWGDIASIIIFWFINVFCVYPCACILCVPAMTLLGTLTGLGDKASTKRRSSLTLQKHESQFTAAILSHDETNAYFACDGQPSRLVQVAIHPRRLLLGTLAVPKEVEKLVPFLMTNDMTREGNMAFGGNDHVSCGVTGLPMPSDDRTYTIQYAFFGTCTTPARILRARLLPSMEMAGVLELEDIANELRCALIGPTQEFAYFGGGTARTPVVVKVRLRDFERLEHAYYDLSNHVARRKLQSYDSASKASKPRADTGSASARRRSMRSESIPDIEGGVEMRGPVAGDQQGSGPDEPAGPGFQACALIDGSWIGIPGVAVGLFATDDAIVAVDLASLAMIDTVSLPSGEHGISLNVVPPPSRERTKTVADHGPSPTHDDMLNSSELALTSAYYDPSVANTVASPRNQAAFSFSSVDSSGVPRESTVMTEEAAAADWAAGPPKVAVLVGTSDGSRTGRVAYYVYGVPKNMDTKLKELIKDRKPMRAVGLGRLVRAEGLEYDLCLPFDNAAIRTVKNVVRRNVGVRTLGPSAHARNTRRRTTVLPNRQDNPAAAQNVGMQPTPESEGGFAVTGRARLLSSGGGSVVAAGTGAPILTSAELREQAELQRWRESQGSEP